MLRHRKISEWLEICEGIEREGLEVTVPLMASRAGVVYLTALRARNRMMSLGIWRWGYRSSEEANRERGQRSDRKVIREVELMVLKEEIITVRGIADRAGLSPRCVREVLKRLRARGELEVAIESGKRRVVVQEGDGRRRGDPTPAEIEERASAIREENGIRVRHGDGKRRVDCGDGVRKVEVRVPRMYRVNRPRASLEF